MYVLVDPLTGGSEGFKKLKEKTHKCDKRGGTPVVLTEYGPTQFKDSLVFMCRGPEKPEVEGGRIEEIPPEFVDTMQESEEKSGSTLISKLEKYEEEHS